MNAEHVKELEHPYPVVLQPVKYVLHTTSDVEDVLSEQTMGLQAELAHIHNFYVSVVVAGPQASLVYVEQAPLVTQPALLVVQVEMTAEQAESDVSVTGNRMQVKEIHEAGFV